MDITLNLDLQAILTEAVNPEKLQPLVNKALSEAVQSAINDATGYSSDFRKTLKEQLHAAMPHGLGVDDLAKFQHVMNSQLALIIQEANGNTIATAMRKAAESVMPDLPATIKLSELIDRAREHFHKEQYEEFFARLEVSDYGTHTLYLDSEESPGKTGYGYGDSEKCRAARYRLSMTEAGEAYSLKLDGTLIKPTAMPNIISRFDALLMGFYVGRTTVEFDIDADDVEYAAKSKDD